MKRYNFIILFLLVFCSTLIGEKNYMKKADEYFQKGKFSLAEIFYKKAVASQPEHFEANYNLGKIYWHQKDFKKSIKYLQTAYDLNPQNEIMFHIATCYENMEVFKKSLSLYSNVIKNDPDYADVYLNVGNIGLKHLYNKQLTIVHWEKFLLLRPDDSQSPNIRKALMYLRDPNFVLKPPGDGKSVGISLGTAQSNVGILLPEIKGKDLKSKSEEKYNLKNKKTITTD